MLACARTDLVVDVGAGDAEAAEVLAVVGQVVRERHRRACVQLWAVEGG
jgi:hypothetical protein